MSDTPRHAIFLSHSGADAEAARRLRKLIENSPDAREAGLKVWFDKNDLVPGSYWQVQIEENIEKIATGFLVYIGSKGIADWVEAEVRLALSRAGQDKDFQFIPILSKDSPDLAALPGFAKLYQAVHDPLNDPVELQKLVATLLRTSDAARVKVIGEPFVGLRSMDEEDAHLFFGRTDELNELVGKLKKHRLVAIVADSGTGKSSLAKAGLIPAFRDGALAEGGGGEPRNRIWHVVVMRPGRDPQSGLRNATTVAAQKMGLSEDAQEGLRKRVTDGDVGERAFALRCDCPPDRTETLLVVDQFEELLTQTPAEKRAAFVDLLMELAFGAGDYGFRVLLTVRADYFNLCREFRALYDRLMESGQESILRLKRISDKGIEEAVMGPLRLAGQEDEDTQRALVVEITRDVSDRPGDVALIQMALYAAWKARARTGGDMLQAYAAVGGVAGALAHEADKVRKEVLGDDERKLLEPILVRLVRLGETAGATRRVARRSEFDDSQLALVEKLTDEKDGRRLLIAGSDTIEIGHEALITQWPWLQGLVERVGTDLRAFERLMDKAARWKRADPDKRAEYLATGAEREEYVALAARQATWISATERDFISASSAAFEAGEWRKKLLLVSLAAAVIVLMTALGVAVFYYKHSANEAREAVANLSAAETAMAESESARHPIEATKLALAAWPVDGKDIAPKLDATLDLLGRVVPQLRERVRIPSGGTTASFSPDGTMIVTTPNDATARIWDATDGRATATLRGHDQGLTFAAFSPDGKTVVTTSKDKTARIWDIASQREIARLAGHRDVVTSAAFSPDGGRVVTASEDGEARIWNALTGVSLAILKGHSDAVTSAAFSPDGRLVVTASTDKTARIWDGADGREIGSPLTHDGAVNSAAFSPDGGRIVTASDDGSAQIWDALSGVSIATLRGQADNAGSSALSPDEMRVVTAAFSPDGRLVVTASADKTARIYDAHGRRIGPPLTHEGPVTSAEFSYDNKRVVTSSADGSARIWDASNGIEILRLTGHDGMVFAAAFSGDAARVVTVSDDDSTTRVWDAARGAEIAKLKGHGDALTFAAFSPDGGRVVTASDDRTARIWDANFETSIAPPLSHPAGVAAAAFNPKATLVATGSMDGVARIWEVSTGRENARSMRHDGPVKAVAFSPDGTRLATGSADKTARIWDAATQVEILRLKGHEQEVTYVAFSPDGKQIVTASADKTARIWDAVDGQEIAALKGHTEEVASAAFSADGKHVVTASWDKTARIWDVATGRAVAILRGHQEPLSSASFSDDGARVVTASADRTARIWDLASGREIAILKGHDGALASAAFSADGKRVVTASQDKTAGIWDVSEIPKGNILAVACALLPDKKLDNLVSNRLFTIDKPICVRDPPPPDPTAVDATP